MFVKYALSHTREREFKFGLKAKWNILKHL